METHGYKFSTGAWLSIRKTLRIQSVLKLENLEKFGTNIAQYWYSWFNSKVDYLFEGKPGVCLTP
jgi:hypothetical protein